MVEMAWRWRRRLEGIGARLGSVCHVINRLAELYSRDRGGWHSRTLEIREVSVSYLVRYRSSSVLAFFLRLEDIINHETGSCREAFKNVLILDLR